MVYKPLEERTYLEYLKLAGWKLLKGSIDYNLLDDKGIFMCSIKISHGKGQKREVVAFSVNKTEKSLKKEG